MAQLHALAKLTEDLQLLSTGILDVAHFQAAKEVLKIEQRICDTSMMTL